jgi:hypothetical protein
MIVIASPKGVAIQWTDSAVNLLLNLCIRLPRPLRGLAMTEELS